jgi:hypothetical protein
MSAKRLGKETFFSRLQPRERMYVVVLICVAFFVGAAVLFMLRSSKISKTQEEIAELRDGISVMRVRGPAYQEKLKAKVSRESQIADTPIVFGTVIERAEGVAEVSVTGQEEKPPIDLEGGLRMRTFQFDLKNVTLDQLTRFIAAVESEPGRVVLAQRLLIRSSNGSEDIINIQVELATWERTQMPVLVEEE